MNTSTLGLWFLASASSAETNTLPGTDALTMDGDLAAQMVTSLDEFVAQAVADSVESRQQLWNRDYRSHEAYTASIAPNRERFRGISAAWMREPQLMLFTILRQRHKQPKLQRQKIIPCTL